MTEITFRPIDQWPAGWRDQGRASTRRSSPFKTSYPDTIRDLRDELYHYDATSAHVQLDITSAGLRQDGILRANTVAGHPGVILTVVSPARTLVLHTDRFVADWRRMEDWHCNLRACYLGLVDLRRMERYGLNNGTAQYAGFAALGTGQATALGTGTMSVEQASQLLREAAGWNGDWDPVGDPEQIKVAYRMAARNVHPDQHQDDADMMVLINEAKGVLERHAR